MNLSEFPVGTAYSGQVVETSMVNDQSSQDDDRLDAYNFYQGRRLVAVNYKSLVTEYGQGWWGGHNFLVPGAFAFYLPALIDVAVNMQGESRVSMLADSLVLRLWEMSFGKTDPATQAALEQYSKSQLGQFRSFLQYMVKEHYGPSGDQDNASPALDRFWSRYLPR